VLFLLIYFGTVSQGEHNVLCGLTDKVMFAVLFPLQYGC